MTEEKHLLLGAGSRRTRYIQGEWKNLVTLDMELSHEPDVVWDLEEKPWPFEDNTFTEVHAYEVMEHLGMQGDFVSFFDDFYEVWRILVPDGLFVASGPAPDSDWRWGDPGHTRYIGPESLVFLSQEEYEKQVGKTPMSDYRAYWKGDFRPVRVEVVGENFIYALRAIKEELNDS